jgi:tetratricopeptide (TPR) repeat protein
VNFAGRLAAASASDDPELLAELSRQALAEGEEEQVLPLLDRALRQRDDARLWQWRGLLERALDQHEAALHSLSRAARLDPTDVSIARGHARTALEAGLDARDLYRRALALAPDDGPLLLGITAARAAVGDGDRAAADLGAMLDRAPAWTYGHEQLAQLLATQGREQEATHSIEHALRRFPAAAPLWETLLAVEVRRRSYTVIRPILGRARAAKVESPLFPIYEGIAAAELDDEAGANLFSAAALARRELTIWRIRYLLRTGRFDELLPIIDTELRTNPTPDIWAYAAAAWRVGADSRTEWLEDSRLIRVVDLKHALPPLDELARTLRGLHVAKGEYLDQSVRGGTQTDGPLLSRIDPIIRALRKAIVSAVEDYVRELPPIDEKHPLLRHRRDRRIRFSGSWSVRLRGAGRHANHVHPQGWISSALYIALPNPQPGDVPHSGWLRLGQPDETLGMNVTPAREIEPVEGSLALFPSWMWHGTEPFAEGERLSVAFDVAPPL